MKNALIDRIIENTIRKAKEPLLSACDSWEESKALHDAATVTLSEEFRALLEKQETTKLLNILQYQGSQGS